MIFYQTTLLGSTFVSFLSFSLSLSLSLSISPSLSLSLSLSISLSLSTLLLFYFGSLSLPLFMTLSPSPLFHTYIFIYSLVSFLFSRHSHLSHAAQPVPVNSPIIMDTNSRGVQINLNIDEYTGDGPILGVELEYTRTGGDAWTPKAVSINEASAVIVPNLVHNQDYEVRVILWRRGPGGRGTYGPTTSFTTTCSSK